MTAVVRHIGNTPFERGACETFPDFQLTPGLQLTPGGDALTRRAIDLGGWRPGDFVLDIGCGGGRGLRILADSGIVALGVDHDSEQLRRAGAQGSAAGLIQADSRDLPLASACAGGILSECAFSLMPDGTATEFHRVLRPDGVLVMTDLFSRSTAGPPAAATAPRCLRGLKSRDGLIGAIETAGFSVVIWEDHTDALNRLVAQAILTCGSTAVFWGRGPEAAAARDAARALRPGYALLVARKKGGPVSE